MIVEKVLLGLLVALLVGECLWSMDVLARLLIRWATWLSYGRSTPQGESRCLEQQNDLNECRTQIGKLCFAFGWLLRGTREWLSRRIGGHVASNWERADSGQVSAAVTAVCLAVQAFGRDIRAMSRGQHRDFERRVTQLRCVLQQAVALDERAATVLATTTVSVCRAYIDDRNEAAALQLLEGARPFAARLGHTHQAVLGLRRSYAAALLALGYTRQADEHLVGLMHDEAVVYGEQDPHPRRDPPALTTCHRHRCHAWGASGLHLHRS